MPRPPYSVGIFMPKQPNSARPFTYSSGICASRSTTLPSMVSRSCRSLSRNARMRASSASDGLGIGCMSSSGKRPRNKPLAKDGLSQPLSRDSSARALACSSVTCACCAIAASSLTTHTTREYSPLTRTPRLQISKLPPSSFTAQHVVSHRPGLGVELPGHGLDHLGHPSGGLAVRVATLAQFGLHGAFQQCDHVLDHAVQLVGAVLVFGGHLTTSLGQAGRRLNQLEAQRLRSAPSGGDPELHPLAGLEALDPCGQRRRADVDVFAVLLRQEAEPLVSVVPLNLARRHWSHLLV